MAKFCITPSTLIAEVLERFPDSIEIFDQFGMGCYVCSGCTQETIEEGAVMHNVNVDTLIKRLNGLEEKD